MDGEFVRNDLPEWPCIDEDDADDNTRQKPDEVD